MNTAQTRGLYEALGLTPAATQDQITRSYRALVRRHHPDTRRQPQREASSDAALQQVLNAYAVLRDPVRRASYDHRLRQHAAKRAETAGRSDTAPVPESAPRVTAVHLGDSRRSSSPPIRCGPVRWWPR